MNPKIALAQFLSNPEQDTLKHLPYFRDVARGNVLEIGVNDGASTSAFLSGVEDNGGRVHSVDINPLCKALLAFAAHPQWAFICDNSRTIPLCILPASVDVLFIDGDHSYEGAKSDLNRFAPLVKSGGLILMHDVEPHSGACTDWPGVRQAFREFTEEHPHFHSQIRSGSWGLGVIAKP